MRLNISLPTIATFVEPAVRSRLDAASVGTFNSVHAESVSEVVRAVRERPVSTVLLSPNYLESAELHGVKALVDNFPAVSTVAVFASPERAPGEKLMDLGASGVRRLVDLCDRNGWNRLRAMIAEPGETAVGRVTTNLLPLLNGASPQFRSFFEVLVRTAPEITTVRVLCGHIHVHPSTLMSRFLRAQLPSPRDYLAWTRLVYAAGMMEDPGLSLSDIAYRLEHSSPQSFGRHVKLLVGYTAGEFRTKFDFRASVDLFAARMVSPFEATLTRFQPLPPAVMLGKRR